MKQFNLKIVLTVLLVFGSLAEAKYLKQQGKISTGMFSEADLDFDPVFLEAFNEKRTREMKGIQLKKEISFLQNKSRTNKQVPTGNSQASSTTQSNPQTNTQTPQADTQVSQAQTPQANTQPNTQTPQATQANTQTPQATQANTQSKPQANTQGNTQGQTQTPQANTQASQGQNKGQTQSIPKQSMLNAAKNAKAASTNDKKKEKLEPANSKNTNLVENDNDRYKKAVEEKLSTYNSLTEDDKAALRNNYEARKTNPDTPQQKRNLIRSCLQVIIYLSKAFKTTSGDESKTVAESIPKEFDERKGEKILTQLLDFIQNLPKENNNIATKVKMNDLFSSTKDNPASKLNKLVEWFAQSQIKTQNKQMYDKIIKNLQNFKTELASPKLNGIPVAVSGASISANGKDVTQQLKNSQGAAAGKTDSKTDAATGDKSNGQGAASDSKTGTATGGQTKGQGTASKDQSNGQGTTSDSKTGTATGGQTNGQGTATGDKSNGQGTTSGGTQSDGKSDSTGGQTNSGNTQPPSQ